MTDATTDAPRATAANVAEITADRAALDASVAEFAGQNAGYYQTALRKLSPDSVIVVDQLVRRIQRVENMQRVQTNIYIKNATTLSKILSRLDTIVKQNDVGFEMSFTRCLLNIYSFRRNS